MNMDKSQTRKIYTDKLKDPSATDRQGSSAYKDYLKSLLKPVKIEVDS